MKVYLTGLSFIVNFLLTTACINKKFYPHMKLSKKMHLNSKWNYFESKFKLMKNFCKNSPTIRYIFIIELISEILLRLQIIYRSDTMEQAKV